MLLISLAQQSISRTDNTYYRFSWITSGSDILAIARREWKFSKAADTFYYCGYFTQSGVLNIYSIIITILL
jgi:hypothetical protein